MCGTYPAKKTGSSAQKQNPMNNLSQEFLVLQQLLESVAM